MADDAWSDDDFVSDTEHEAAQRYAVECHAEDVDMQWDNQPEEKQHQQPKRTKISKSEEEIQMNKEIEKSSINLYYDWNKGQQEEENTLQLDECEFPDLKNTSTVIITKKNTTTTTNIIAIVYMCTGTIIFHCIWIIVAGCIVCTP